MVNRSKIGSEIDRHIQNSCKIDRRRLNSGQKWTAGGENLVKNYSLSENFGQNFNRPGLAGSKKSDPDPPGSTRTRLFLKNRTRPARTRVQKNRTDPDPGRPEPGRPVANLVPPGSSTIVSVTLAVTLRPPRYIKPCR